MNAPANGIIKIHGKEYHTVAKRVNDFREQHGDKFGLVTEIVENGDLVTMRALIIGREDNFVVATGTAEEKRNAGQINRTSALENCETSAIGRALAAFGIGGTEFASANEVQNAIHQQGVQSQGDDQGAVNLSATDEWGPRPKGDGPTKGKLDTILKEMVHEIEGCGDEEMLTVYTETSDYKEGKKVLEEYRPSALHGPPPPHAPEFVPLRQLIAGKVKAWRAEAPELSPLDAG